MDSYEKLGVFYLGRGFDLQRGERQSDYVLYDAKDLTTHAVVVGMTGSGKTGLGISLLEEAGLDSIPAIVVDPKGDLANLCLTFPDLRPTDFRPWVDPAEAARQGLKPDALAKQTAKVWKQGLADWDQDGNRIRRFREAVDLAIYTPGSSAGRPLSLLKSFAPPPPETRNDADAFRERVSASASGLLTLMGADADPVRSREHILLSNLFDRAWRDGRTLDIAGLIREIQSPPIDKVGVLDLETFYPAKDRQDLSMSLNNLLASPAFAAWLEGEPLDIQRLLYTPSGKPRISIISIAHLDDPSRMFLVTMLLNELLTWMRSQPGTSSLRALFYMDEVFGYFPPTANPPSKLPMLTLLKQARAFGLGCVLATQNPVDLDYKGLSNTGTWFLGRLQTERDKLRVLEGLEGAAAQAGSGFDRQRMDEILAGLGSRVFLMNNVHEDEPVLFQTRWVMSYLRGPLTRNEIQRLTEAEAPPAATGAETPKSVPAPVADEPESERPLLPAGVTEYFGPCREEVAERERLLYRPTLLGRARLHFVRATYHVDHWREQACTADVAREIPEDVWEEAEAIDLSQLELDETPRPEGEFASVPAELSSEKNYGRWQKQLKDHLYRTVMLTLSYAPELKLYSEADEPPDKFAARLRQRAFEERDLQIEKLRKKYADKLQAMEKKIERAGDKLAREEAQYQQRSLDSVISIGSTLLGALLGRKWVSRTNVSRAGTSARSVTRAARERTDVQQAEEEVEELKQQYEDLERELEQELDAVRAKFAAENVVVDTKEVRPRKSDLACEPVAVLWQPWIVDRDGIARPAK